MVMKMHINFNFFLVFTRYLTTIQKVRGKIKEFNLIKKIETMKLK